MGAGIVSKPCSFSSKAHRALRRWGKLRPFCSQGECRSPGGSGCSAALQVGGQSRRLRQQNPKSHMQAGEGEVIAQGGSGKGLMVPWCPSCNGQSPPAPAALPVPTPQAPSTPQLTQLRSIPRGEVFQGSVGWDRCCLMESALNFGEPGSASL